MSGPAVLVRFSDEEVEAAEAVMEALGGGGLVSLSANEALRRFRNGDGDLKGCTRLGFVGDPPADGIGYGLAPVLALLARPRTVTLIDERSRLASSESRARYLTRSLGPAVAQLAASSAGIVAQRLIARYLLSAGRGPAGRPSGELGRVLYVRPLIGTPARVGGSITHSHGVIRAFRDLSIETDPLTNDHSIAETAAQEPDPPCVWRVVGVPRALKAAPASTGLGADLALALGGYRSAMRADAIYQRHARFSMVGAILARATGTPLILEYNGPAAFDDSGHLARQLVLCEDAALATATLLIVGSDVGRRDLEERGIPPERVVLNPNGVDPDRFTAGGGARVRGELGLTDDEFLIGFLGSFAPWHGAPKLAEAFGRVAQTEPRARLLLVGDGSEKDEVRRRLAEAGVGERARFLGKVAPTDVPDHLDACDVLAAPNVPFADGSEFFGSPTKVFEYMAAGKGIVASRLGQIEEILGDRAALLVEPGNVDELAEGILRLIASPDLRRRLGEEARLAASERYSWKRNGARVAEAYRDRAERSSRVLTARRI